MAEVNNIYHVLEVLPKVVEAKAINSSYILITVTAAAQRPRTNRFALTNFYFLLQTFLFSSPASSIKFI